MEQASTIDDQATRISLNSQLFGEALERYIDDNKPDPLALKQLKEWKLEWSEDEDENQELPKCVVTPEGNNDDSAEETIKEATEEEAQEEDPMIIPFSNATHWLRGSLKIHGKFMFVTLRILCAWAPSSVKASFGSLYYICLVNGEFKKVNKKKDKIAYKIISRLRQDDYISSIVPKAADNSGQSSSQNNNNSILARAKIQVDDSNLEERVHVSESHCEAVKRAVWSSAESPLDVIELILNLPSLPCMITSNDDKEQKTPLANRAKLRLLEDAMVDACEQEGEGEIISDLKISETTKTNDDDDDGGQSPQKKKKKRSN